VDVFDRDRLRPRARLRGPALVTQLDSTTVVPPGWTAVVDGAGNLVMERT
jgi:N-methylhydantoinase A/oxoprolinase/acetone carboxylase beta subunit